jgi:hypothetical protein
MKINYLTIPVLSIGFTRSTSLIARGIQLFSGTLHDKAAPNHAFIVTEDHGQLFATEETLGGLRENSLEEYTKESNRIVAMYYYTMFDNPDVRNHALCYMAEIRRKAGENTKYDFKGLFSFVPGFRLFCKPDPVREWCSENCASIMKRYGAPGLANIIREYSDTPLRPDELLAVMSAKDDIGECYRCVLNYYV